MSDAWVQEVREHLANDDHITTHHADCWKYHAGCVAVGLLTRIEELEAALDVIVRIASRPPVIQIARRALGGDDAGT